MSRYKVDKTTGELSLISSDIRDVPIFNGSVAGIVPLPTAADNGKVLKSDGSWGIPDNLIASFDNISIPFVFGIDENGNYGYKKAGADTVTPFKSTSNVIKLTYDSGKGGYDVSEYPGYENFTVNNNFLVVPLNTEQQVSCIYAAGSTRDLYSSQVSGSSSPYVWGYIDKGQASLSKTSATLGQLSYNSSTGLLTKTNTVFNFRLNIPAYIQTGTTKDSYRASTSSSWTGNYFDLVISINTDVYLIY